MKLEVSDKTGGFGKRPHIKKGYYPGRFLGAEERTDRDDKPYEGQYGRQLIMQFAVYAPDKAGDPSELMTYVEEVEGQANMTKDLILPKFVYHMYKNRNTGELSSAVTPNSAITKILRALGWTFDATKPVDIDTFKDNFVELNIDDYEDKDKDGKVYKASTIKDISVFEGKTPSSVPTTNKEVPAAKEPTANKGKNPTEESVKFSKEVEELRAKIKQLDELKKDGNLSESGYNQAVEQIEAKIQALQ